tara:strand:+ start:1064 stop:1579 length:516 start_codon:yes stop_codon:yes gene_type:complete
MTIMHSDLFTGSQKLDIIFLDLVVPQIIMFDNNHIHDFNDLIHQSVNHSSTFTYSTGNSDILTTNTPMFTAGRLHDCTVVYNSTYHTISRCNFVAIKIREEIIILSGWSIYGTRCCDARPPHHIISEMENSCFLRFRADESFAIACGHPELDARYGSILSDNIVVFNPPSS